LEIIIEYASTKLMIIYRNLKAMNIEEIREYCISKPGVSEGSPFNDTATANFAIYLKIV